MPHPPLIEKGIKVFLFCCTFFYATASLAQSVFTPVKQNTATIDQVISRLERSHQAKLAALTANRRKDLHEIYSLRWKLIREKFNRGEIYTNPDAQKYLDGLVHEIVLANPGLFQESFDVFFSKSGSSNASYLGEGIILFNMGLFKRLSNESQAAFVICHELAHFYLQHSDESIQRYVGGTNKGMSKKTAQRRNKNINGSQAQQSSKRVAFSTDSHQNESQADSMALELMKHTRFDGHEAISLISLFETTTSTFNVSSTLQKIFNSDAYPFREAWMAAPVKLDIRVQSLFSTHPDTRSRIAILQNFLKRHLAEGFIVAENNERFSEMQKLFGYEIVEYYFAAGNYSKSLFHALEIIETYPVDPYLTTQIGKILLHLSEASPSQTLGKFVELPSCYQPEDYNVLLNFLLALQRDEFASISYHFLKQYELQLGFYQPFRNALNSSIQIAKH